MNYDFFYSERLIAKFQLADINNLHLIHKPVEDVLQYIGQLPTNNTYKEIIFDAYRYELSKLNIKKNLQRDLFDFGDEISKFKKAQPILTLSSKKFDTITFCQDGIFYFDYADFDFSYILTMAKPMLKKVAHFKAERVHILLKYFTSTEDFIEIPLVKWPSLVFKLYQAPINPLEISALISEMEKFSTVYSKREISHYIRTATKKLLYNGLIKVA